jgi:hypothetical protein
MIAKVEVSAPANVINVSADSERIVANPEVIHVSV